MHTAANYSTWGSAATSKTEMNGLCKAGSLHYNLLNLDREGALANLAGSERAGTEQPDDRQLAVATSPF